MNTPTPEQIAKLPKWAQEHIETLTRNAERLKALTDKLHDEQTPSPAYALDYSMLPDAPKKRYLQMQYCDLVVEHADVRLQIHLSSKDDGQRDYGIELRYEPTREVRRSLTDRDVTFYARGYNCISIAHRKNV